MGMFVFPGQGSQQPGMGQFLCENFKLANYVFDEASEVLNLDIKKLCFNSSVKELALTENTQPAILTTSVACSEVLKQEFNVRPQVMAGHSVGEYAALVTAQILPFSTAIKAVRLRGQAMQSAVAAGVGGMAAVLGLSDSQVIALCSYVQNKTKKILAAANFNCPGQVVISGETDAIDWLKTQFKPEELWVDGSIKKLKLIPLQVSAPFHCSMMLPAETKMATFFKDITFKDTTSAVIQNYTAQIDFSGSKIKENLIRQISAPVKWTQSILEAKKQGHQKIIEVGNGRVLQGLIKKIDPDLQVYTTNTLEELKHIESLAKDF